MLTPLQFSKRRRVSRQRVMQWLKAGRIVGARFYPALTGKGGRWGLPENAIILQPRKPWEREESA